MGNEINGTNGINGVNDANGRKEKTLGQRIFAALFLLSLTLFCSTSIAVVVASWSVYEADAESQLVRQTEAYAAHLSGMDEAEMSGAAENLALADSRCTLVAGDGRVLYDNVADPSAMGDHGNREEIMSARDGVESVLIRRSETTGTDTLYAAILVPQTDVVLRLSETRTSIPSYLGSLALPLAGILVLMLALSWLVSRVLTRRIVAPLLHLDLEKPAEVSTYRELTPLLERIASQRDTLVAQNEQLERSMEVRREFTSNVSHEMKSPLQVIGGYAELIESGMAGEEDARKFAGLIRSESQSMRVLIDDVLTLSRLDENYVGESSAFDLGAVCKRVEERLSSAAKERDVLVRLQLRATVTVEGSESLAEQMVYNLVDNAIAYGRQGGIVRVCLDVRRENTSSVAILSVADDGPGIPDDAKPRVFERFYRVDQSRSRETGGTGLGLAIVKHAAEAFGGVATVGDSAELGGAEFTITLPWR